MVCRAGNHPCREALESFKLVWSWRPAGITSAIQWALHHCLEDNESFIMGMLMMAALGLPHMKRSVQRIDFGSYFPVMDFTLNRW
jgi:hypothetical protein